MESVVVVEPVVLVRELLAGLLESAGYLVFAAADLNEATELVAGVAPCLLILSAEADVATGFAGIVGLWSSSDKRRPLLLLHDASQAAAVESLLATGPGAAVAIETFDRQTFLARCHELAPVSAACTATPTPQPATLTPKPASTPPPVVRAATQTPSKSSPPPAPTAQGPATQIDEVGLLKTLSPVVNRDAVDEATARGVMLPLDAKVTTHVQQALTSEAASPAELCRAIARDGALTLRVLAAAGAASAGQRQPVASLSVAIDRIGKAGVAAILSQAQEDTPLVEACEAFSQTLARCNLDRRATWRHAHAVALIAGEVARLTGGSAESVQAARTAGWLHDLGRQVMAFTLTDGYAEACEAAVALGLPLTAVENQMMLDHHGQLMEKLLRSLKLAPALATAIGCHQFPLIEARNLAGKHFQETITLAIADRYAAALGTGDPIADPLQGLEHHAAALKLDGAKLAASLEACRKQLDQDVAAFSKLVSEALPTDPPWLATLDAGVRQTLGIVFIGNDAKNDPFAVLARQFGVAAEIKPNVAIVRLTNVRDRDPLTGKLRGWEFEQGVSRLPLLLVSPKGNLTLEDSAMNGRAVQCLAEPVLPRQLASALNALLQTDAAAPAQAA
ncbi:MAG: HDOD domain-containing protein [Planctomycetota bacterium]